MDWVGEEEAEEDRVATLGMDLSETSRHGKDQEDSTDMVVGDLMVLMIRLFVRGFHGYSVGGGLIRTS